MVARTCYLMCLGSCLLVIWLHEQPKSSLMTSTKFWKWLRQVVVRVLGDVTDVTDAFAWLGAFGHETMKPTQLVCSHPWVEKLERKIPDHLKLLFDSTTSVAKLDPDPHCGHRRVSGAEGLKGTQVYPWDYAREVRDQYQLFVKGGGMDIEEVESDSDMEVPFEEWAKAAPACAFPEARLEELGDWLNLPSDKLVL